MTGSTDCLNCGICQQQDRQTIVGLPAHGSGAKRVQKVFFMKTVSTVTRFNAVLRILSTNEP